MIKRYWKFIVMVNLEKLVKLSYYLKGFKLYEEHVELYHLNQMDENRAFDLKHKAKNEKDI